MIPSETFCENLRTHELEVLRAFDRDEADYFIEEWHRRGYKTSLAINLLIRECCKNPLSKYLYIAPTQVWARNVVWDDPTMLWGSLPDKREIGWTRNEQKLLITFTNGSMLKICGSDEPDDIRGVDFDGCVTDEFSLHDPTVWTQILMPIMAGGAKPKAKRHRWMMFLYCVTGDTLYLSDKGFKRIGRIGDVGFADNNEAVYGLGGFHPVTSFYNGGLCPVKIVTTKAGYQLRCTGKHRVWDGKEWLYAADVKVGDKVAIQRNQQVWGDEQIVIDKTVFGTHKGLKPVDFAVDSDFYYLLGLIVAEGNWDDRKVTITNNDVEIHNFLRKYGFKKYDEFHSVLSNTNFCKVLDVIGIKHGAHNKNIPDSILRASKANLSAFLSGYFDGDGHSDTRGRIGCCSCNEQLIRDIQVLLLNYGICSHRSTQITPVTKKVLVKSISHRLTIEGYNAWLFFTQIGFRLKRKQDRVLVLGKRQRQYWNDEVVTNHNELKKAVIGLNLTDLKRHPKVTYNTIKQILERRDNTYLRKIYEDNFLFDTVASIEDGEDYVYDFVIPDTHSFFSNGFISHNTPKGDNHATQLFNISACIESEEELPTKGQSERHKERWFCSRVTADKSGIIPQAELDNMLEMVKDGRLTQADYDQEMLCRRVRDEERTLITSAMLDRLNTINWDSPQTQSRNKYRIVAIDPAFGGDLCSIQGLENGKVIEDKGVHYTLTSEVIFEAKMMADRIGTKNFIVDCIGNGKGVADGLAQDAANYYVQYFNSAGKVEDSTLFANKKAETVQYVSGLIRQVKLPPVKDPETRRQLVGLSRYKVQQGSGKMIMMPNDEVKKLIGCSPDKGLCYIYGQYGLKHVEPVLEFGTQIISFNSRAGCVPSTLSAGVA